METVKQGLYLTCDANITKYANVNKCENLITIYYFSMKQR